MGGKPPPFLIGVIMKEEKIKKLYKKFLIKTGINYWDLDYITFKNELKIKPYKMVLLEAKRYIKNNA